MTSPGYLRRSRNTSWHKHVSVIHNMHSQKKVRYTQNINNNKKEKKKKNFLNNGEQACVTSSIYLRCSFAQATLNTVNTVDFLCQLLVTC